MQCQRCSNFASEYMAIVEHGQVTELHVCRHCAEKIPELAEPRRRALQMSPTLLDCAPARTMSDLIERFHHTYQREPNNDELFDILRVLLEDSNQDE